MNEDVLLYLQKIGQEFSNCEKVEDPDGFDDAFVQGLILGNTIIQQQISGGKFGGGLTEQYLSGIKTAIEAYEGRFL